MTVCDSNIFVEYFRKNNFIRLELEKIGYDNIVISEVVQAELFFGARDKTDLQNIAKCLDIFPVLAIRPEISKMAVNFVKQYCLSQKLKISGCSYCSNVNIPRHRTFHAQFKRF